MNYKRKITPGLSSEEVAPVERLLGDPHMPYALDPGCVCVTHISIFPRPHLFGDVESDGLVRLKKAGVPVAADRNRGSIGYVILMPGVSYVLGRSK